MAVERIFYVTPCELVVYRLEGGGWSLCATFPSGSEGVSQLDDYLAGEKELLSCLYTDLIEEEYRNEKIPHVGGRDRRALLQRKLRTLFRATPFRTARVQGRERSGRRDNKVLFSALTNPDNLTLWLDKLMQHKVPIIGIYSLSTISQRLLRKLKYKFEYTLLLTEQRGSLLRQSFFNGYDLKASRLMPMNSKSHERRIETLLREVQKNQRYLNRMQLLPHDAKLDVCILTETGDSEHLRRGCPDSEAVHYHFIDINHALQQMGLQGEMAADHSEQLFLHLLHERLSTINYARPVDRRYYQMRQIRKGLIATSLLFALISSSWSLNNLHTADELEVSKATVRSQINLTQKEYQQALAVLPDVPMEPSDMQALIEGHRTLMSNSFRPRDLLVAFSKGLDANPRIQLEKIEWQTSDHQTLTDSNLRSRAATAIASPPPDAMDRAADNRRGAQGHDAVYQIATLKGHLDPVGSDYYANFKLVKDFIESLRQTGYFFEVTPSKMPLNVDPSVELSGDYQRDNRKPFGKFEIKAVVKVQHGAV